MLAWVLVTSWRYESTELPEDEQAGADSDALRERVGEPMAGQDLPEEAVEHDNHGEGGQAHEQPRKPALPRVGRAVLGPGDLGLPKHEEASGDQKREGHQYPSAPERLKAHHQDRAEESQHDNGGPGHPYPPAHEVDGATHRLRASRLCADSPGLDGWTEVIRESHRPDSGAGEPAGVVGSRVAAGHHGVTRSALDAARRWAESGAQGRRLKVRVPSKRVNPAPWERVLSHARFVLRSGNRAGRSSQQKYDELMKAWRQRNRVLFRWLAASAWLMLIGSLVLSRVVSSQAWLFGVLGGMAFAVYLTFRLSGPGWIENWQQGVWGEQSTAKALRPLERLGWVVLHDLPAGRGNVDHIAIGAGGVFLLDSKRLGGSATVTDGILTVERFGDSDLQYTHPGPGHLLGLARETHDRVRAATRLSQWVTPVMVMWGDFPQRLVEDRCVYLHGDELAAWLASQPQRIAPNRVGQVAEAVKAAWKPVLADAG